LRGALATKQSMPRRKRRGPGFPEMAAKRRHGLLRRKGFSQ
jgi:hypothetical protein